MPWQPDGSFLRTNNQFTGATVWDQDQQAAIKIIASRHDYHDEDLATGIEGCISTAGYNKMLADLDMNDNKIVNLQGGSLSEEGQWTPQLVDPVTGTNNSVMNSSPNNFGWYIRAGRLVSIYAQLDWTSTNNQADKGIAIGGMPFGISPAIIGSSLSMYAGIFLAGSGMAVSGIGSVPPGTAVLKDGGGGTYPFGGTFDAYHPEAQIQGVVAIAAGENYDPNNPSFQTFADYFHLRSYFGTNNTAVNGYGNEQYPYYYSVIEQTGRFGFQLTYLTNDPL